MHPARVFYEEPKAVIETNENQKCLSSNRSLGLSKFFNCSIPSQTYKPPILVIYAKEHEISPSPDPADSAEVPENCETSIATTTSIEEIIESEQPSTDESDDIESETDSSESSDHRHQRDIKNANKLEFSEKSQRTVEDCKRKNSECEKKLKNQLKPDNIALNQFIQLLQAEEYTTTESKVSYASELRSTLSLVSSEGRSNRSESSKSSEFSMFELIDIEDCWTAWDYENQSNKLPLFENITRSLDEHPSCNNFIRISFGKINFNCHRLILRYAKFFHRLEHKTYEFQAGHRSTAIAFMIFYQFAMGIQPMIQAEHFLDVLQIAEVLNVPALQLYCMKLLDSKLYHEQKAFEIFKVAKCHLNLRIQRLMLQRIWKFFMPFVATRNFLELEVDDVCRFLEADTVGVNSEIEIFYAAVLWLSAKWKKRRGKILERVMSCVRYGLLPPWFTYSLKRGTGIAEVDRILELKCVGKMIEDGASIAATIGLYFVEPSKFESILHRLLPKVPKQRSWVFDRNCTYHYGAHEKVSEAVDFIVFKDYLNILEIEGENYWRNFQEAKGDHLLQVFSQKFSDSAWSKMQF